MLNIQSQKRILLTLLLAGAVTMVVSAQQGGSLYNQAETLFKNKNYYEASQVYEKYLQTERHARPRATPFAIQKKEKGKANLDPHQEAVYHLAESYRLINDYKKAEKYYKEAITFSEKAYPNARYWYALTLRANGDYKEALVQITAFLEKHTEMDDMLMGADREVDDLKFIQLQSERINDQFTLHEMKEKDTTTAYALSQRQGDTVVFTEVLKEKTENGETLYTNTLFESSNFENPLLESDQIDMPTQTGVNDGMPTFSYDGKFMFFTKWTKKTGHTQSDIYLSRLVNKKWTEPVKAAEPINMEGANSAQPFLTKDDRYVIFSSNRDGGFGGYDLWAASLDTNHDVIQVQNLGNVINTTGDEDAPYFHDKSRTLVFSSNGRVGMGGFDIFYAAGNFNLRGWEKPVNAGAPLNSSKDDIYFVSTDDENLWNTGWISSDRESECCLALFSVRENNSQYVNGTFVDCETNKPLTNVAITVTDLHHPDRVLGKYHVDSVGRYTFELHNTAHFKISAVGAGYNPKNVDVNLPNIQGRDSVMNALICMSAIKYPQQEVAKLLKSLERSSHVGNFEYKKAHLSDSAHDNLDSLAVILKKYPDMVIQIEGYTDGIGSEKYNLRLAQKRVDVCIKYLLKKGVPSKQLVGKAMGKCCPVAPETIDGIDNAAGREANRRVEYKVLKP